MEFKFNINEIFRQPIVEINHTLIPPGFSGDRRALWDAVGKVAEVVNAMGEASAAAQGLTKPITTAERLRNSEQRIYLLIDQKANNGRGAVTGMLKTGSKGLYVFNREGHHYQVSPVCVLDFYVHESRQRSGYGRHLFEHMLQKEKVEPVKMAIDRPSDKFLGFLKKHYKLSDPIKQMNNYVVFDEFFPRSPEKNTPTPGENDNGNIPSRKQSANGLQTSAFISSPYGRYGAPRPTCSMNQIIHNQTSTIQKSPERAGARIASHDAIANVHAALFEEQVSASPRLERPRSLSIQLNPEEPPAEETNANDIESEVPVPQGIAEEAPDEPDAPETQDRLDNNIKKISLADVINPQEDDKPVGKKTPSHLTEQGFLDLKFYHSKLW